MLPQYAPLRCPADFPRLKGERETVPQERVSSPTAGNRTAKQPSTGGISLTSARSESQKHREARGLDHEGRCKNQGEGDVSDEARRGGRREERKEFRIIKSNPVPPVNPCVPNEIALHNHQSP